MSGCGGRIRSSFCCTNCNAFVEEKDTHTLSATTNSLGSKSHFRLYLQVIKLTDEEHLTQLAD